jgi:hypothetical protein
MRLSCRFLVAVLLSRFLPLSATVRVDDRGPIAAWRQIRGAGLFRPPRFLVMLRLRVRGAAALGALLIAGVACPLAIAKGVPLPRPRPPQAPALEKPDISEVSSPSACRLRLTEEFAIAPSLPPVTGPDECQATDMVRLKAVVLPNRTRVTITPPAILRCPMAEAVVGWVRESVAPQALDLGSSLRDVENLTSFYCRGRNGVAGAQISEHGKANALDVHSLRLANGKVLALTDPHVSKNLRDSLRTSACARFTTVLGPGSDGFHEDHLHIDLLQRRTQQRIGAGKPARWVRPITLPRAAREGGWERRQVSTAAAR